MLHLAHGQINVAIMVVGEIILAVSAKTDRGIMNWMARSENTVHRKKDLRTQATATHNLSR